MSAAPGIDHDGFCQACQHHVDAPAGPGCRTPRLHRAGLAAVPDPPRPASAPAAGGRHPDDPGPSEPPDETSIRPGRRPLRESDPDREPQAELDEEHGPVPMLDGVLSRADLGALPTLRPLIADTLDRRSLAVLAGWWGTGKSFVALDWACAVATGRSWAGRDVDQPPGGNRVLMVVGEGAHGVDERITAWETDRGVAVERLWVYPRAVNLLNVREVAATAEYVRRQRIDLVVIDTLSRCMAGADENSARDLSAMIRNADRLRDARPDEDGDGPCILIVHHTGKDRVTVRGSSVLEAAADTVYLVEGDGKLVKLARSKRKDGPRDDEHTLSIRWVEGTDSAVVRGMSADISRSSKQDQLLSVFVSGFSDTGASKAELRAACEMPPATFHRALNALVRRGGLINSGTEKRPFYNLAPGVEMSA